MDEYNPLDYENLTRNCVNELMQRGPFSLPPKDDFEGCGVYALFYVGDLDEYSQVRSENASIPIYVGKAEPGGGRKGNAATGPGFSLSRRLGEHSKSIQQVNNLKLEDFLCRYLVVTPLWIKMAERLLLERYKPVWNSCLDGFGNHDPGKGRHQGEVTWWDAIHPGRKWSANLRQTRSREQALKRLEAFLDKI